MAGRLWNSLDIYRSSCCTPGDAIKKVKRKPNEWEKTFANNVSD